MNEGPADPAQPSGSGSASTPPGSRFEDLTNLEVPSDAVATGHRTAILVTAAVVLFAGALFAVLYVVLLLPFASSEKGSSVSGALVGFLLVYGSLQAVAGVLVLLLRQSGRWLGIVLGYHLKQHRCTFDRKSGERLANLVWPEHIYGKHDGACRHAESGLHDAGYRQDH